MKRMLRAALVAALALGLAACTGLPTSGPVSDGLRVGAVDTGVDVTYLAAGPVPGASPREIVEGFIEAGMSPVDNWGIARQFLAPELAATWRPEVAVTIDRSWPDRSVAEEIDPSDRAAAVQLTLAPVASLDATGVYSSSSGGSSETPFELVRNEDDEWRIVSALDGIVLDEESFRTVFRRYSLQYFDPVWEHLVPDPRWFPRRDSVVTTITRALVAGDPSGWLADSVRSAFPSEVLLAHDAVPVGADDQIAEVALTETALALDETTLGRMRTQLERSLAGTGVSAVRFTVGGRELAAERAETVSNRIGSSTFVLTEDAFGSVVGDEVSALPGVSARILGIAEPVTAIDVSGDTLSAAVQLESGAVWRVTEGRLDELDPRPGLVVPSLDSSGYTWSVPRDDPQGLIAWSPRVEPHAIAGAWPEASAISQLRIAPDGVRVAAVISLAGQEWLALAGIIRDDAGEEPTQLGPVELVGKLPGPGLGLAWLGEDTLGVLTVDDETPLLLEQTIGGAVARSVVPPETVAIAGADNVAGARLLSSSGVVSIKRGAGWQESFSGVRVLATQAGK